MERPLLILAAACTLATGCSTDLDINAPYKNVTVVEGLLNMRDSLHLIKINKGYLGAGDALVYAQVQDSNEWNSDAFEYKRVVRRRNGQTLGTFELRDTVLNNREPGTFYSPTQRLYYFTDTYRDNPMIGGQPTTLYLDPTSEYSIELKVKGEEIGATTNITNDFSIQNASQNISETPAATMKLFEGNAFRSFELGWSSGPNGKRYVADYRFNYREVRNGEEGELKSFTRRLGTVTRRGTGSGEAMNATLDGRRFYEDLAASIPDDPNVQRRIFLGIDLIISVANDEFHTFLTLTEPISGIIEDRPAYSNVQNGYGVFGSRYVKQVIGKRLSITSFNELRSGDITGHLRFCSRMPFDAAYPFYCTD